jgi:hypothetical protein
MSAPMRDAGAELRKLEPIFHTAAYGPTRQDAERFVDKDFWEVGASGNTYSRDVVLQVVEERLAKGEPESIPLEDFQCREVGAGIFLVTYVLHQPDRPTRRSTLWRSTHEGWKMLYHQGTPINTER